MQLCVESSLIPSLPPSLSLLVCFTNRASLQYEKQGYAESVHILWTCYYRNTPCECRKSGGNNL